MNELLKALSLKIEVTSPEAMLVALFGIAALVYLSDKAMQQGYEIQLSEGNGLSVKPVAQRSCEVVAASKPLLKADQILQELNMPEGTPEDSQEVQTL